MDIQKLVAKLHPYERVVVPLLKKETELKAIVQASKLQEVEVMRALQWLENKAVVKIHNEKLQVISLEKNGKRYKRDGLPEKAFLNALSDEFKGLNVVTKKSKLAREEVNACIGILKKQQAIETKKEELLQIKVTEKGKKLAEETTPTEHFLQHDFPILQSELHDADTSLITKLKRRKLFLKVEERKKVTATLTPLGEQLAALDLGGEFINRLTAGMLKTGCRDQRAENVSGKNSFRQ
jgi:predicted transcriptional regulator